MDPNQTNEYNDLPPIMIATDRGNLGLVKLLLKSGANPNKTNIFGETLLHSIYPPHPPLEIVKALVNAGADPNLEDNDGETPLDGVRSLRTFSKSGFTPQDFDYLAEVEKVLEAAKGSIWQRISKHLGF